MLKKWAGCVVSLISGILGLAMSATSGMVTKNPFTTETTKASEVLTNSDLLDASKLIGLESEFAWLKTVSVIMVVVSVILIVYGLVLLLKNINVIKSDNKVFGVINLVLSVALLVVAILLITATGSYCSALSDVSRKTVTAEAGFYQPFMLGVGLVATLVNCAVLFVRKKK